MLTTRSGLAGPIDLRAARTAEAADGPLAILGVWAKPARLLVVRRGKPLSIGETDDGSYFGSLAGELPGMTMPIPDGYAGVLTCSAGRTLMLVSPPDQFEIVSHIKFAENGKQA
jgi:hypothetical protein